MPWQRHTLTSPQRPDSDELMMQGNISEWKVKEGQELAAGDIIAEIETDKATMDWESQVHCQELHTRRWLQRCC